MSQEPMYVVRDAAGATYGPANVASLRQWIEEGRITAQMQVALQGTENYVVAGDMPEFAGAFSNSESLATTPTVVQGTLVGQPGMSTTPVYYGSGYAKSSGMAVGSLVCGIVGIFICPLPIVAVILGHIARGQIRRDPERFEGSGMALGGLVMGYGVMALWLAFILIYVLFFVIMIGAVAAGAGAH